MLDPPLMYALSTLSFLMNNTDILYEQFDIYKMNEPIHPLGIPMTYDGV